MALKDICTFIHLPVKYMFSTYYVFGQHVESLQASNVVFCGTGSEILWIVCTGLLERIENDPQMKENGAGTNGQKKWCFEKLHFCPRSIPLGAL